MGLPVRQALIELAHEGFDAELRTTSQENPVLGIWMSNRVRLTVDNGVVTDVVVG